MFSFGRLFGRRTPDRHIFRFWDGSGLRAADPLEAWRAIEAAAGDDWQTHLRMLTADPPPGMAGDTAKAYRAKQEAAAVALGAAAVTAFGVEPLSPTGNRGLTRAERVGLVAKFLSYMADLAERHRPLASWPGPSEPSPA